MPNAKHGLFVTDLDGTLLRTDATVSEYSLRVINRAVGGGVRFTVATSRSPDTALSLLRGLHLRLPIICLNGAVMVDPVTGGWLSTHVIARDVVEGILHCADHLGAQPFLLGAQQGRDTLMHLAAQNPVQEAFLAKRAGENRMRLVPALEPLQTTLAVTFVDSLERLRTLREHLAKEFAVQVEMRLMTDLYFPGGGTLELSCRDVDKVRRVSELSRSLGVEARNVTVFGDHINDLSMFAFAGTSVAVANAQPEVLAAAKLHCGANDSDGVARFLEANLVSAGVG